MAKRKLNIRIHDPYPPEVMSDYIFRLFLEVDAAKVDRAIERAHEEFANCEGEQTAQLSQSL